MEPMITDMSDRELLEEIAGNLREIRSLVADVTSQVMPTIESLKDSAIGKMLF